MFRLLGMVTGIGVVAVVAGSGVANRTTNFHAVEGEVIRISRTCTFNVTSTSDDGRKTMTSKDDSCNATNEFSHARIDHEKRGRKIVGKAKLTVSYDAPEKTGQLGIVEVSGKDDVFYTVKKGDKVKLLVSKADPEKIELDL